jgi:hypothetical protein
MAQSVQNLEFVNKEISARAADGGFDTFSDSVPNLTSFSSSWT